MPLLKCDLIEGRDPQSIQQLLDVAHRAVVTALGVPERDRYQIVYQHPAHELIIQDTGLGLERSDNVIVISITSRYRTVERKQKLYKTLVEELESHCGIDPQDIVVSLVTTEDADWSFGCGEAQFLTGKL
jgi:hypothetical protein